MRIRLVMLALLLSATLSYSVCPCEAKAAMQVKDFQRMSCNYQNVTCHELNVTEIDIGSYSVSSAELDEPDYLEGAEEDCDLYYLSMGIASDMRGKQMMIDLLEKDVAYAEDEADDLLEEGNHTLSLIHTVEHQYTFSNTYPSVHTSHMFLGGMYHSGFGGKEMISSIENLYMALEDAQTAWNYLNASLQEMRDIEEGIEDFCVEGKCMFPEQKEYYADLLAERHYDVGYYADQTERFLDDAQDYMDEYYEERGDLNCSGMLRMPVGETLRIEGGVMSIGNQSAPQGPMQVKGVKVMPHGKGFMLNDSGIVAKGNMSLIFSNGTFKAGKKPLKVLPSQVASKYKVKEMGIVDEDGPKYVVRYKRQGKLLGFIPVEMDSQAKVSAEDGSVVSEEKPFWSFLVFE